MYGWTQRQYDADADGQSGRQLRHLWGLERLERVILFLPFRHDLERIDLS